MFRDRPVMILCAAIGAAYGLVLGLLGLVATGAGHGTYVLLGLTSAPFGLTQNVIGVLIGALVLWPVAAFLAAGARYRLCAILFVSLMAAHYASLFWILNPPSKFADWSYVPRVGAFFWVAIGLYGAGQVALWGIACRRLFGRSASSDQGKAASR